MKIIFGEGSQARPRDPLWGEHFFNSSESVFQVKKVGGFLSHEGGGGGSEEV